MRTKKTIVLYLLLAGALLAIPLSLGLGQGLALQADLGDAPDSTNAGDQDMEAYAGVTANFPTVFAGPNPTGPIHQNAELMFYLGSGISGEEEADSGVDTDPDGTNNIVPTANQADNDGADDGLNFPNSLPHCQTLALDYTVTVTDTATEGTNGYLNVWLDWDRDGAWGGESPATCPGWTGGAPEWAVQNQPVSFPGPGTYALQTPDFPVWNPNPGENMWLRVTLSEAPAPGDNGAGPPAGYNLGETEDYLLPGQGNGLFLPLVVGGVGEPPPPPPEGVHIDEEEDPEVMASWPQVPAGTDVALIGIDDLTLRMDNNSNGPRTLDIRLTFIADGHEYPLAVDPLPTIQAGTYMTDVIVYPAPQVPVNSPGVILGEVHNMIPGTGEVASVTPIEAISFHGDESASDQLVVYREDGLQQQVSTMDFVQAPALSSRLAGLVPTEESTTDLTQFIFYNSTDPVLAEEAVDPASDELIDIPPPPPDFQTQGHNVYIVCPEWYTAPVDNGFGEDYGLNDDGWRARGARVRIWQSGVKLFDGWLNAYGCTAVYSYSTAGLYIHFTGESRLASGGGYINLLYIKNSSTTLKATSAWIGSPVDGGVYRPEVHYRDSVGMLSYAAQERFNGGVSGKWFYLRKAGCGNDPDKGSCSTSLNGDHIIYMSSGQWRRKFIAGHEYGHKILSFTAGYTNDCSFGGGGHSMKSVEYGSCAAMEGWAHFVSADIWNNGHTGENPGGKFVYWNSSSTVYDVEAVGSECYDFFYSNWLCDAFGTEIDWMRHWWDFHTNDLPNEPGSGPSHATMFDIVNDVSWENGAWEASDAIEDELSGSMDNRWRWFACWNSIAYDVCQ